MSAPQSGSPSPPPPSVEQSHPTESRWVPDDRAKADVAPAKAGWGGAWPVRTGLSWHKEE